jgi:hypothetical protein
MLSVLLQCSLGYQPHATDQMHVMVVYSMSIMNLMTFAKARPAQMIFITTSNPGEGDKGLAGQTSILSSNTFPPLHRAWMRRSTPSTAMLRLS